MPSRPAPAFPWLPYLLGAVRVLVGLIFFQHGAEKIWGFANGRIEQNYLTLRGFAGPLEVAGGALLILGLFTRTTAFILCGEMAVAYFLRWAPRGFWPISNGGEEAVIFCFLFLWLVTAGGGPWSVDSLIGQARAASPVKATIASWEGYARSLLRIILAFVFTLHGFRHSFGYFSASGGRRAASPMALDGLPPIFGGLEILGGVLLFLGLFTRPAAVILCAELLASYFYSAVPRGVWPIRNGGNEVLLYFLAFLYFVAAGAGAWSLDHLLQNRRRKPASEVPAATPVRT